MWIVMYDFKIKLNLHHNLHILTDIIVLDMKNIRIFITEWWVQTEMVGYKLFLLRKDLKGRLM